MSVSAGSEVQDGHDLLTRHGRPNKDTKQDRSRDSNYSSLCGAINYGVGQARSRVPHPSSGSKAV